MGTDYVGGGCLLLELVEEHERPWEDESNDGRGDGKDGSVGARSRVKRRKYLG